jgi:hypothetical protein
MRSPQRSRTSATREGRRVGGADQDRTGRASLRSAASAGDVSGGGHTAPPKPPTEVASSIHADHGHGSISAKMKWKKKELVELTRIELATS